MTIIKKRYLILTDIYFLLFDPIADNKNYAILVLVGDIRDIGDIEETCVISENNVSFKWKDSLGDNVSFISYIPLFLF